MAYDGSDPGQNNYVENSQIFPGDCYGQDQKGIKNGAIFPTKSCMVMWPPSMLDKQLHCSSATQSFFGNLNINVLTSYLQIFQLTPFNKSVWGIYLVNFCKVTFQ